MCTTVIAFDPGSPAPVVLIGVRDEFLDRPWVGPGRHWPRWPDLIGGRDLLAGGTWLAVNSATPRVACVLNGRGKSAAAESRLSRGELPLLLAAGEISGDHAAKGDGAASNNGLDRLEGLDLPRYDPFHLLCATPAAARRWSWDGEDLAPGLHIVVNSGLEGEGGDDSPAAKHMQARVDHFGPLLAAAQRPEPPAHPGPAAAAWGDWLSIADGAGLDPSDPRALLVRGSHLDRAWGSSSVSLVALTGQGVRYEFRSTQDESGWATVLPPTN